jgi:hypothetical protein
MISTGPEANMLSTRQILTGWRIFQKKITPIHIKILT